MFNPAIESDPIGPWSFETQADPEVPEQGRVRTHRGAYKLRGLREYEAVDKVGKGALLRRKALYSWLLTRWPKERHRGALAHTMSCPGADPGDRELARLRKEQPVLSRNWTGPGDPHR